MNKLVSNFIRLFIGTTYTMAGLLKMIAIGSFIEDVSNLDILPAPLVGPAAIVVIAGEILFGFALVAGYRIRIVSFALALMTCVFSVVIALCYMRGISPDCGCFGPLFRDRIEIATLLRDVILIAGCLWLTMQQEGRISTNQPIARGETKSEH